MAECGILQVNGLVTSDDLTAKSNNVLSGMTYMGADTEDDSAVGTMTNNGAFNKRVLPTTSGQVVAIPEGYHNGQGTVIVSAINPDFSNTIQTATTNIASQANSAYRKNGQYIEVVPAVGWWGSWDWNKSHIKVPITSVVPYLADLKTQEPNNNYTYNENWIVPVDGVVHFKWNFSDRGTSEYFVYVNGQRYSTSRTGEFEVAMTKNSSIRWGYTGQQGQEDDFGLVTMVTMAVR